MPDSLLTIVVETSFIPDKFVWVIMEGRDRDEMVEVSSSLGHYDSPSEAYCAGEVVLRTLGLAPPPGENESHDPPSSAI